MIRTLFQKHLFLVALVLVATQQIYFPQEQRYFHLALLAVYAAFNEMVAREKRDRTLDAILVVSVLLCSAVSIAEHYTNIDISVLYRMFLATGGYAAIRFFLQMKSRIRMGDKAYVAEKHHVLFNRSTVFIEWMLVGAGATTFLAVVYIFTRFFIK